MVKKLLFGLSLALGFPATLLAQRTCGTMDHLNKLEQQHPGTKARLQQTDRAIAQWQNQAANQKTNAVVTIPVVVHVIYRTANQNISQAQIESQIAVLNEDFSRTNADAINTPTPFKAVAGDMQIRFELAKRDPNGDPTNGITRTQTSVSGFGLDDAMKFTSRGGRDAWDRDKYLNIWVCNIGGGILGYAQFPGSGPERTDGVVIGYNYFGRVGTVSAPFNKGRTATHEVGHFLGLYHIWGDEPGCANDDMVADTPLQRAENYGCPAFPKTTGSGAACTAGSPGAMFMNYMDYTDDGCMNLFTEGQVQRARGALQTQRPGLLTSDGATAVIVKPLDAAIFKIKSPVENSCNREVLPRVILKNRGSVTLTSATISYKIGSGAPKTYSWTGNLPSFATETITLPRSEVSFGSHSLTVSVASPNGQADNDPTNDALTRDFTVTEQTAGLALPFAESFEAPTFPPQGWILSNPDKSYTWERTRRAAFEGFNSAYVNNYDYEYIGEADHLQMPALNIGSFTEPQLTFSLAYTPTRYGNYADTLEVLASTDCGVTFTSIYKKAGRQLATIASTTGNPFFPNASQWRTDSVDLNAFGEHNSVILQFRSVTGYENNLFIDDVQVYGKELKVVVPTPKPSLVYKMYPNPTAGALTFDLPGESQAEATVIVMNSIGKEIMNRKVMPEGNKLHLNLKTKSDGIYFIYLITEFGTFKEKLVLDQAR